MSWKKIGGRDRTQTNYIVRNPQATIDIGRITDHLGSETSSNTFKSGMNVENSVSIMKRSTSEVNPDHIHEPAELTIWNGTVLNDNTVGGERIDSLCIYHTDAPLNNIEDDIEDDIEDKNDDIVFKVGVNNGVNSFSGMDHDKKALIGINQSDPYFDLDVGGDARFNSSRIGLGNGRNNEPYDIVGKVILAGNETITDSQYQPLLQYRGAGTIRITGYVYVILTDMNYTLDVVLQSTKIFINSDGIYPYTMTSNNSSADIFNYINISVYSGTDGGGGDPYYYVECSAITQIITKLDVKCPYTFYVEAVEKMFYEYPTSLNLITDQPSGYEAIASTDPEIDPDPIYFRQSFSLLSGNDDTFPPFGISNPLNIDDVESFTLNPLTTTTQILKNDTDKLLIFMFVDPTNINNTGVIKYNAAAYITQYQDPEVFDGNALLDGYFVNDPQSTNADYKKPLLFDNLNTINEYKDDQPDDSDEPGLGNVFFIKPQLDGAGGTTHAEASNVSYNDSISLSSTDQWGDKGNKSGWWGYRVMGMASDNIAVNFGHSGDDPQTFKIVHNELGESDDLPTLSAVGIETSNTYNGIATTGDTITLSMTASTQIYEPIVSFSSNGIVMTNNIIYTNTKNNTWTASFNVSSTDTLGSVSYTITFSDSDDIPGTYVSSGDESITIVESVVLTTEPVYNGLWYSSEFKQGFYMQIAVVSCGGPSGTGGTHSGSSYYYSGGGGGGAAATFNFKGNSSASDSNLSIYNMYDISSKGNVLRFIGTGIQNGIPKESDIYVGYGKIGGTAKTSDVGHGGVVSVKNNNYGVFTNIVKYGGTNGGAPNTSTPPKGGVPNANAVIDIDGIGTYGIGADGNSNNTSSLLTNFYIKITYVPNGL